MKHPYFWGEVERGRFIGFSINGRGLYELIDFRCHQNAEKVVSSDSKR